MRCLERSCQSELRPQETVERQGNPTTVVRGGERKLALLYLKPMGIVGDDIRCCFVLLWFAKSRVLLIWGKSI